MTTVRSLRWFAGGKCLVQDEESGETFSAARLVPGERSQLQRFERGGRRIPVARRILEPSPHRVEPACGVFASCTGCDLLHVSEAEEVRFKQLTVQEVLARHAGVEVEEVEFVGSSQRGGHRVRAHFELAGSPLRMGLRGFDGEVVHEPACRANHPAIQSLASRIFETLGPITQALSRLEIGVGVEGTWLIAELDAGGAIPGEILQKWADAAGVVAVATRTDTGELELAHGEWPHPIPVDNIPLSPAPGAWTQPTPAQASALYRWVRELGYHRGARVLDGTCGIGGLSFALAADAEQILGVDANWEAIQSAQAAAQAQGVHNVEFRGGKLETVAGRLARAGEQFGFTLINPMRISLGEAAMAAVAEVSAGPILYLAPAPRAGAADIRVLVESGFRVDRAAAINLHPGSAKVMMGVALLPARG